MSSRMKWLRLGILSVTILATMPVTVPAAEPRAAAAAEPGTAVTVEPAAAVATAAVQSDPGSVVGGIPLGVPWQCILCLGVIIGVAGTTILGAIALLAAYPELGVLCGFACFVL